MQILLAYYPCFTVPEGCGILSEGRFLGLFLLMADSVSNDASLQRISDYRPGPMYEQVSLQLFGMQGHGKSSFINTCMNIVHGGAFTNVAGSGKSDKPITMERKDYNLSSKVLITDNRGLGKMSPEEQEEMAAQMGHMRNHSAVKWDRSFREKLDLIHQKYSDCSREIIVPVFVYSAESLLTKERYAEIESFIREAHRITDIYPIIVLTKVATHRHMTADCYSNFKKIGAINIFQVENYTVEIHEHNPETQAEILRFLDTCLHQVDENVRRASRDPKNEYMRHAMDQVYNIVKKESENTTEKFQNLEEKCKEAGEELKQTRKMYKDKEQELREVRQRRKSRCSVM
ncbi:uncharacterized protein [Dendrobates tinctorius]|uniref:uncharacterized protein n=1 Tax=Dendrobates tinctorius TaxID=92724 RepID=UPI003CCA31EE